ncbi:MAG TPA: hypothetical protein VMV12_05640 [Candidatus Micrarchaeaceae archaeon]|nr:hypothetical protein [Candidatus Micrarchaeaceae archaeon]
MATLTLKIEGPPGRVPASALATVLTHSVRILENLREAIAPTERVTWYVTGLRMGSAQASISAESATDVPLRIGREYVTGLKTIEDGQGLPAYFSDQSLWNLERMATPLRSSDAPALTASVGENGTLLEARMTSLAGQHVDDLRLPKTRALGSITGVLDTITVRREKPKFQVFDPVSRRPVVCQFPKESIDAVKSVLAHRVNVEGIVVRNGKGQPLRVEESELRVVEAAPPLVGLVGLDPDFTGGLPLSEYMERICS